MFPVPIGMELTGIVPLKSTHFIANFRYDVQFYSIQHGKTTEPEFTPEPANSGKFSEKQL